MRNRTQNPKYCHKYEVFRQRRQGLGSEGLLGRLKYIITRSKCRANQSGYAPIKTSPEEMLRQWDDQQGKCKACDGPLNELISLDTVYDHDHETGEGRGFVHSRCNLVEGCMKMMSGEEINNLVQYALAAQSSVKSSLKS